MSEPMKPMEIEQRSFEIITELLGNRVLDPENELVIKRVIHTTADFDYADNLVFFAGAAAAGAASAPVAAALSARVMMAVFMRGPSAGEGMSGTLVIPTRRSLQHGRSA